MRITRAAKVAAFPLTALILVALVACQGPIGPRGPSVTGPTGPPGPSVTGPTGPTGPTGIGVLQLVNDDPAYILVNDDARGRIGVLPDPVDVSTYFRGGKSPVTYALVKMSDATEDITDMFTAVLADGMLTVTLTDATATGEGLDGNYAPATDEAGSYVTVKATDADKHTTATGVDDSEADGLKDVHILRNKDPIVPGNAPLMVAIVGTQAGKDGTNPACKVFNVCEFTIPDLAFDDDLYSPADGMPADHFTFTATTSRGEDRVSVSAIGRKVTLTGVAPTYNKKPAPGDYPAIVTITARDPGGLSVKSDLMVTVDGPPRIAGRMASSYEVQLGANNASGERTVIENLVDYFDDPEDTADTNGGTTTYQLESSNPAYASIADANGALITSVMVTAKSVGATTITVTAKDSRGQTSTQSFTLQVKANAAPM